MSKSTIRKFNVDKALLNKLSSSEKALLPLLQKAVEEVDKIYTFQTEMF